MPMATAALAERSHLGQRVEPQVLAYPSALGAGYVLALLVLAAVIAYIDQQVFALLVTPVKSALALSDADVGILQGVALNLCMGLTALPIGRLIDRTSRVRFFLLATTAWSAFTGLCGLCTSFAQLFACRVGVGVAEAGLYAAAYSLIADLYPLRRRSTAILIFYGGVLASASAATMLSSIAIGFIQAQAHRLPGVLGQASPWRLSFAVVAAPGLALALGFLLAREPARQAPQDRDPDHEVMLSFAAYLRTNWVTVSRLVGGNVASAAGFGTFLFWMPTILSRAYGYSTETSGEIFSLAFGAGTLSGILISALMVRVLRRRSEVLASLRVLWIGSLGAALATPLMLVVHGVGPLIAVYILLCTMTYVASPMGPALLTGIAPNRLRAQVFSINQIATLLLGTMTPPLVGLLSDKAFSGPEGLLHACCAIIIPLGLLGPLLLTGLERPVLRTIGQLAGGGMR
jgi:MFS family permease